LAAGSDVDHASEVDEEDSVTVVHIIPAQQQHTTMEYASADSELSLLMDCTRSKPSSWLTGSGVSQTVNALGAPLGRARAAARAAERRKNRQKVAPPTVREVGTQCKAGDLERAFEGVARRASITGPGRVRKGSIASDLDARVRWVAKLPSAHVRKLAKHEVHLEMDRHVYFTDLDAIASDEDDEDDEKKKRGGCQRRVAIDCVDLSVAVCPALDGADALLMQLRAPAGAQSVYILGCVGASLLLSLLCFTGSLGGADGSGGGGGGGADGGGGDGGGEGIILGTALPAMLRSILHSGILSVIIPPLAGNVLLSQFQYFPLIKQADLPWSGLWLGLRAPVAPLVPLLSVVPMGMLILCTWLLMQGYSLQSTIPAGSAASIQLGVCAAIALLGSFISAWQTLVRISLTREADPLDIC
jgi:hypothetical protein